jgi:hypothetical protein
VSSGALVDFVNTQVTAPLDIQALTATGRDGDFLIAKAAYSLRSLGTRQATVTSSGDTDGDTSGKFVCQVRRSSDDALKSFTADEITDGTLLSFVGTSGSDNGFVSKWYDQSVSDQAGSATGNHATQATASKQPKIVNAGSLLADGIDFDGTDDELETAANISGSNISGFVVANLDGTAANSLYSVGDTKPNVLFGNPSLSYVLNGGTALSGGTVSTNTDVLFTQLFISGGTSKTFINGSAIASGDAGSNTASSDKLTIGNLEGIDRFMDGSIEELIIYASDQTDNRTAIEANIGEHYSISGIPAFDNSVNGFVETWYDQSGNGNDALQSTAANQPKIVDSGSLNASGGLEFDGTNDILTLTSSISFQNKAGYVIALQDGQDSVNDYTLGVSGDNRGLGFKSNKTRWFFTTNVIDIDNSSVQTGQKLYTALHDGTTNDPNVKSYVNGSEIVDSSPDSDQGEANSSSAANQIGARRTLSFLEGTLTELIIYDTDQTNNRAALETEIINHYGL